MIWRNCRLGDVLTLKRGHDLPGDTRIDGDIPVVSSSGITGYHNEAKAKAPGVVTGRYGTLGEVFYLDQDYWPLNTALYVIDFKETHPRFAAYFLKNVLRHYQSDKAAVPGVDRNVLHEIRVSIPDTESQEKIAAVLSSYDGLVENNMRRIKLLEESAKLLYNEWFVSLRFPGYEHTRTVKGVPEGWDGVDLGDVCDEIREMVAPQEVDPETPYIGLEHMPRRSITLSTWGKAEEVTSSKHKFREGDILFGRIRPYFHKVGLALVDGVASSDAIILRPKEKRLASLLLLVVSSDRFVAEASQKMKEGSKMPRADWKIMQEYAIALPPHALLDTLNSYVCPITQQLKLLTMENRRLKDARDILLPKLMNGEMEA